MVSMEDQIEELKDEVADLKGEPRTARGADAVNAKVAGERTATFSGGGWGLEVLGWGAEHTCWWGAA